jgi:predicted RNase H-like HicB family nuclease
MRIDVIIEKGKKEFWGRIEGYEFLPVTVGTTVDEVLDNLKMLIADYIEHEGKDDKKFKRADVNKIKFDVHYDLRAFFDEYKFLNISSIAALSGINPSLVRQYAKGIKHPSTAQAKKVEATIHQLAEKMNRVSLVGSTVK